MLLLASFSIGAFAGAVASATQPGVKTVYTKEAGEHVKPVPTATFAALELRHDVYATLAAPTFKVTLCPEPTGSFAALSIESDLTFGCKPGFVCNPPKPEGCNFWPGPPPDEFRCQPDECMVTPPLNNVEWEDGKTGYYPPQRGYFNLNPEDFGLSYDIFEYNLVQKVENGHTSTFMTGNWESQASLTDGPLQTSAPQYRRRAYSPYKQQARRKTHKNVKRAPLPSICFDSCNTAYNIALKNGKSPELCEAGSDFENAFNNCVDCVATAENITKAQVQAALDPPYSQFLFFCDGSGTTPTESTTSAPESAVTTTPTLGTSSQFHFANAFISSAIFKLGFTAALFKLGSATTLFKLGSATAFFKLGSATAL
ncbi:hypothetical protein Trco_000575 [Trichoderma cornu-damae]|uniref:Uncharacterized protein n=1 Tax=Trichoderma cornu-damae TaxID=654480 RepID=A0A9P8QS73_9HYPO|nr:hypothetical protein Trco_000575 [Trichoderma cornu-damae]